MEMRVGWSSLLLWPSSEEEILGETMCQDRKVIWLMGTENEIECVLNNTSNRRNVEHKWDFLIWSLWQPVYALSDWEFVNLICCHPNLFKSIQHSQKLGKNQTIHWNYTSCECSALFINCMEAIHLLKGQNLISHKRLFWLQLFERSKSVQYYHTDNKYPWTTLSHFSPTFP